VSRGLRALLSGVCLLVLQVYQAIATVPPGQAGDVPLAPQATVETSPTPSLAARRTVTLDDYGQTFALHVGEQFILELGSGYDWTVRLSDSTVLTAIGPVPDGNGWQTLYEAVQLGETTLSAEGRPQCDATAGPCPMLLRGFRVRVVVS
jgi:hypothetical protein